MAIITVGIDLAKNVFAVHGVNDTGKAELVKPKVPREQLLVGQCAASFGIYPESGAVRAAISLQGGMQVDLPWVGKFSRAKQAVRLPTVLSVQEMKQLLQQMDGITGLVAHLRYGTGMRLMEVLRLRVKATRLAIYTSPMNDWFDPADSTGGGNTYHG